MVRRLLAVLAVLLAGCSLAPSKTSSPPTVASGISVVAGEISEQMPPAVSSEIAEKLSAAAESAFTANLATRNLGLDRALDGNAAQSTLDGNPSPLPFSMMDHHPRSVIGKGKVKGGNIVPKPSVGSPGLWAEWDWTNWIKPQVDRAIELGLNAIRIIGAPQVVLGRTSSDLPAISLSTYNARWEQLASYCLDNGLFLYPSLTEKWAYMYTKFGGLGGAPPWNFQDPTVTSVITSSAAALAKYTNIIGFDIFQEGSGSHNDGLVIADVLALYAAIRQVAPGIPLTTSDSSGSYATADAFWDESTSLSYQLWVHPDGADFVDVHIYLEGVNPAQLDNLVQSTERPVVIGEYGGGQDITSDARVARYRSAQGLHNRVGVIGSFVWALADQGATDDKKYGVFDNTGFSQPAYPSPVGETPLSVISGQRTELVEALRGFD